MKIGNIMPIVGRDLYWHAGQLLALWYRDGARRKDSRLTAWVAPFIVMRLLE